LHHYGLKPLKTKEAAKKHLLAAFGSDLTLKVPEKILRIEKELKEEYAKANIAAEKEYEEKRRKEELEEEKRRKQKLDRQQSLLDSVLGASNGFRDSDSDELDDEEDHDYAYPTTRDIHNTLDNMPERQLRTMIRGLLEYNSGVEEALREYALTERAKAKRQQKVERLKEKRKGKTSKASLAKKVPSRELQGKYDIVAPRLSENWSQYGDSFTLKICPSSSGSRLWGAFEFGIISGIIRSTTSSTQLSAGNFTAGLLLDFSWRGREESGETTFDARSNTGHLVFLGDGLIKGKLHFEGYKIKLAGKQADDISGRVVWAKHVPGWKQEWRGYNRHNYNVENIARWGKYGGERRIEAPADSDTTDAGRGSGSRYDSDEAMDFDGDEQYCEAYAY
ncbi:hypothetical protein V5O48_010929, partial [Marasmius crinis-equi]